MNRRRLEGEALRDAMLAVSGLLNLKVGGPAFFPELPAEMVVPRGGWKVTADVAERNRRSVYVFVKRNLRYPVVRRLRRSRMATKAAPGGMSPRMPRKR